MTHCKPNNVRQTQRRAFSLLEMVLALGISGALLGGVWQLLGSNSSNQEARALATQASAVAVAAQTYVNDNKAALLGLAGLSALNNAICIKVTESGSDPCATVSAPTSLQAGGYLPANTFSATNTLTNSYSQSYMVYVRREDDGTMGSADADDRLAVLVLSVGGCEIPDRLGRSIVSLLGPGGGFIFDADDTDAAAGPAAACPPTSTANASVASGTNGSWRVNLTLAGWSGIGANAQQGHIAILANLLPSNAGSTSGGGSSAGATTIDALTDGLTDNPVGIIFMGEQAAARSGTHGDSIGAGYEAFSTNVTHAANNVAIGDRALTTLATGFNNVAVGAQALMDLTTGSRNVAVGFQSLTNLVTGDDNTVVGWSAAAIGTSFNRIVAVGNEALLNNTANDNVAVGHYTMSANTSGSNNVAVGNFALTQNQTGSENVAVGVYALASITDDSGNVAVGDYALTSSTVGHNTGSDIAANTAVGANAMRNIDTGLENVAAGANAMQSTAGAGRDASRNVAIGSRAMDVITTGDDNVGVGFDVLGALTTGSRNTAVGRNAALLYSTGNDIVAIGEQALDASTAANNTAVGSSALGAAAAGENTAFGFNALLAATGARNTMFGSQAGDNITTGDDNTGVGRNACGRGGANGSLTACTAVGWSALGNATGANNTAVGKLALLSLTSGIDNTAFGENALLVPNGGQSHNTAIGYAALQNLNTAAAEANTAIGYGTGMGFSYVQTVSIGYFAAGGTSGNQLEDNVAIGANSLSNNNTNQYSVAIGYQALINALDTAGDHNVAIGYQAGISGSGFSNTVALGNGAQTTASNQIRFGNASITSIGGQVGWSAISDRREKKDIAASDLGLDFVLGLKPVRYRLRAGNNRLDYGFIAQDILHLLGGRRTNIITREGDKRGTYRLTAAQLMAPIVKGLQEQDAQRLALAKETAALQTELDALRQRISSASAQLEVLPAITPAALGALEAEQRRLERAQREHGRRLDKLAVPASLHQQGEQP